MTTLDGLQQSPPFTTILRYLRAKKRGCLARSHNGLLSVLQKDPLCCSVPHPTICLLFAQTFSSLQGQDPQALLLYLYQIDRPRLKEKTRFFGDYAVLTSEYWLLTTKGVTTARSSLRVVLLQGGPDRPLHVDGDQVASDKYETGQLYPMGNLQIGVGKNLDPASFWLGLIDDVRVYNQAALTAEEIEELAR